MKARRERKRVTAEWLRRRGVKEVLIPGLLVAGVLGWTGWQKLGPDIYKNKTLFPETGIGQSGGIQGPGRAEIRKEAAWQVVYNKEEKKIKRRILPEAFGMWKDRWPKSKSSVNLGIIDSFIGATAIVRKEAF